MSVDAGLWATRSNGRGSFLCRRMQTSDLKPLVSASFAFNCNNKIRSHGEGLTIRVCFGKPLSQDQYSMFKQACVPAWKAKYGWSPAYAVRCCVFYQRRYYISHHSEFLCWYRQDESYGHDGNQTIHFNSVWFILVKRSAWVNQQFKILLESMFNVFN